MEEFYSKWQQESFHGNIEVADFYKSYQTKKYFFFFNKGCFFFNDKGCLFFNVKGCLFFNDKGCLFFNDKGWKFCKESKVGRSVGQT